MNTSGGMLSIIAGTIATLALAAPQSAQIEIRRAEYQPGPELTQIEVEEGQQPIYLHDEVELSGKHFKTASVRDEQGHYAVEVTLTDEGAKKMGTLTKGHMNRPLAILVDGKLVMAPRVRSKIGQKFVISGGFTEAEAKRLAEQITSDEPAGQ
ncbi:MAG: hypothetical protein DWQ37_13385 [Planctomycetota bacterium]|nr:MAG: hypothetical protein DWQ37_13385 [Planctomycetota bacterium]